MRAYVVAIATLLTIAAQAYAEPAKDEAAKPAQPQQRPAQTFLASADPVIPAARQVSQPSPTKRRVAPRVMTCRCGDPQAEPDSPEQR